MACTRWQGCQFRAPLSYIGFSRVEAFALADRVKDTEEGCSICTAARSPLPAKRIAGQISVYQRIPEPCGTCSPADELVLGQKARCDHADSIVHPASLPELAHAGIDERNAGVTTAPRLEIVAVALLPWEALECLP